MDREIKFRGKRVDGCNNWVYGSLVTDGKTAYIVSSYRIDTLNNDVLEPISHPVMIETVGQYMGIKDNNCVEIYEGNIIKVKGEEEYHGDSFNTEEDWEFIGEIKLNSFIWLIARNGDYLPFCDLLNNDIDDIEVIGNTHDNPKLLEENTTA